MIRDERPSARKNGNVGNLMTERARARATDTRGLKIQPASISRDARFICDHVFLLILRPTFRRFTELFLQSPETLAGKLALNGAEGIREGGDGGFL